MNNNRKKYKNFKKDNKKIKTSKTLKKINVHEPLSDLLEKYPILKEVLLEKYGLHCVNCFISDFDTLEQGALIHGIEGEYFKEMIKDLENIINQNNNQ